MTKAVMKPQNQKIAFLTFKIVEETIKRASLKVQLKKLMPVQEDTLKTLKKYLLDSKSFKAVKKGSLVVKKGIFTDKMS